MKKRILSMLLALCMMLMLVPMTALAEGETPEPVTEIAVEVKIPIVGESLEYSWGTSSTPTDVIDVDLIWARISKDAYTGGADDPWEDMFGHGYPCSEDYYYMVVCPVKIYNSDIGSYVIPNDVNATINGKKCDIQVADDGNSCQLRYIFEATVLQPVSNVAVAVNKPVWGETPNFSSEILSYSPEDSVTPYVYTFWSKLPKDLEPDPDSDAWEEMEEDEVFTDGYYYCAEIYLNTKDGFSFDENTSFTANGKTITSPWLEVSRDTAFLGVIFDPLEPLYTVTAPFTITVEQGGSVAPGKTSFELRLIDGSGNKLTYDDEYFSAVVTTDGAGDYKGELTITAPFSWLYDMLYEGAFIWQYDGEEEGWTYDDTVWGVRLYKQEIAARSVSDVQYSLLIYPAKNTTDDGFSFNLDMDAGTVSKMTFTNTYTNNTTQPGDGTQGDGTTTAPSTGDSSSSPALWISLLTVSVAGMIALGVYSKRRRSSKTK